MLPSSRLTGEAFEDAEMGSEGASPQTGSAAGEKDDEDVVEDGADSRRSYSPPAAGERYVPV